MFLAIARERAHLSGTSSFSSRQESMVRKVWTVHLNFSGFWILKHVHRFTSLVIRALFEPPESSGTKIQPKEEVLGRISLRTSGQKLRLGPPNPGKTSISARTSRADVHEKISQPQSITQKGVHACPLTAREREHWFSQHLSHFPATNFGRQ